MGPSWYLMPDVFERFFGHFGREPTGYYDLTHLDPHYRVFFKDDPAEFAGDRPAGDGGTTVAPTSGGPTRSPNRGDGRDGRADRGDGRDGRAARSDGRDGRADRGGGPDSPPNRDGGPLERAGPGAPTPTPPDEPGPADVVDVVPDRGHMQRVFEAYEDGAGESLERYLVQARETYERGMEHFVYTDRPRFRDYVDLDVLRNARGLGLLGSMEDHVADYFDHPKLRQLVQYSLVFLGGSPTNTPALYNLMSHVDFGLGVHYPDGGMGSVVDGVVELGRELGVTYHTGKEVTSIQGSAGGFRVAGEGWSLAADLVVSDADYAHTEQHLLDPEDRQYDEDYWESRTYAPSAFLIDLGVEGELDGLAHHSLVLPTDWDQHFAQIFDEPAWPDDPAYYLCVPSRTDDSVAPAGCGNLFALVPVAPGLEDDIEARERYRDVVLDDIAENTGVDLRGRIVVEEHFCVSDFASRYNSREGTALGLAHTLRQTGPMRPGHRSSALDGLYFVGAYTTPGIGVPMCLISGQHTADAVLADHDVEVPWA
jgi:phytoene desaturase